MLSSLTDDYSFLMAAMARATCTWQFILLILVKASINGDNETHILHQLNHMACDRHKLYISIMEKGPRVAPLSSTSFHQQATIPFMESMHRAELAKVIEDLIIVLATKINITSRAFIKAHPNEHINNFYRKHQSNNSTYSCCSKSFNSSIPLPFSPRNWTQLTNKCLRLKNISCPIIPSKYRNMDGTCNNLAYPHWGSINECLLRLLPSNYGNGFNSPRLSVDGKPLPNPRLVSNSLRQADPPSDDSNINHLFMGFGQFVAHDLASVPTEFLRTNSKLEKIMCCNSEIQHDACLPIDVTLDKFYKFQNVTCLNFVRSAPCPTCSIGPRENPNKLTAYLDGSQVYGISEMDSKNIRKFIRGQLRVSNRSLLPDGLICNPNINRKCFLAGDTRANENLPLTAMQTLFVREHNRIAGQLHQLHPNWTDQVLYQEAKRIVIAELQVIVYAEYLPTLLGVNYTRKCKLNLNKDSGLLQDYNPNIQAGIFNVFTTNAFRFGHSTIQDQLLLVNRSCQYKLPINNVMFNSFLLHDNYGFDSVLVGLLLQKQNKPDEVFTAGMADTMFAFTSQMTGLDLAAINILRARERGIPSYNSWRSYCRLDRFKSFQHMNGTLPTRVWTKLKHLYNHVDDVDLFPAALAEPHLPGASVGPTFACIIAHQFSSLRHGDRFFFQVGHQPSSFTREQVLALKKSSLARLICDNNDGEVVVIQPNVFRLPDADENAAVPCTKLPRVDLSAWLNEIGENQTALQFNMGDLHQVSCGSTSNQSHFYFLQPQTALLSPYQLNCAVKVELNSFVCALNIHLHHFDPRHHHQLSVFDSRGNDLTPLTGFIQVTILNDKNSNNTHFTLSLHTHKPILAIFSTVKWKIHVQQVLCTHYQ